MAALVGEKMRSLDEIKSIAQMHDSGPIIKVALEDAIKWVEAYRKLAEEISTNVTIIDRDNSVDAEAARIVEGK